MDSSNLELSLDDTAKSMRPGLMSATLLLKIITIVETTISDVAEKPEENHLPAVALTGIGEGSILNTLQIGPWARSAALIILSAIQTGDYSKVPHKSHKRLLDLSNLICENNLTARFRGFVDIDAEISADKPIPQIKKKLIKSKTRVYGEVKSVGGEKPAVSIRLFSTEKLLQDSINEEIAKELGKKLYDYVGLSGTATIDLISGEYVNFTADEVLKFKGRNSDPCTAIDRIETHLPEIWKGVNRDEFLSDIRDDEEAS